MAPSPARAQVHIDFFKCVEYDLIEVEDDVVFGSLVRLAPRTPDDAAASPIVIRREANVLDHSLVLPGAVVGERAVLGTFSLAAKDQVFAPGSVATGNAGGRGVVLRRRPEPGEKQAMTPLQKLEAEARRRHRSAFWFFWWNAVNCLVAVVFYPLRDVFETGIIAIGYMLYFYAAPKSRV